MKKISKLQTARLLPAILMIMLSILLLALSPLWPEYSLWKGGLIILLTLSFVGLVVLYDNWLERLKEQENNSKKMTERKTR